MVVFTTHVIPGDIVDLQVTKKRKNYMEARVTNIREKSKDRQEAFCKHFGTCGGCKWQFLPYEKQLFYKQKQVEDQLRRLGRIELPQVTPILGSAKNTFYRNKLEFSFSNKRWLTHEDVITSYSIHYTKLYEAEVFTASALIRAAPLSGTKTASTPAHSAVRTIAPKLRTSVT